MACLAKLAYSVVPKRWSANAFHHIESCGTAELNFWVPERTIHVHPVVVSCALQRLSWNHRSTLLLLFETIFLLCSIDELLFEPLLLAVSVGLFLVRDLWLLIKFRVGIFVGT